MPTWHPAALLRDETKKIDFIKDLKKVVDEVNQTTQNISNDIKLEITFFEDFYKIQSHIIIVYEIKCASERILQILTLSNRRISNLALRGACFRMLEFVYSAMPAI